MIQRLLVILALFLTTGLYARTEYITYDTREGAIKGLRSESKHYKELNFKNNLAKIDVSVAMLDREIFLHFEGLAAYNLYVNDNKVATGDDARQINEYNIREFLTDGENQIKLEPIKGDKAEDFELGDKNFTIKNAFIYSQSKVRVDDYLISIKKDSLKLKLNLQNSFNTLDSLAIGYDIYSPSGKLVYYNLRELQIKGNSCDTLIFNDEIIGVEKLTWTSEKPQLYNITIYTRRNGVVGDYINFNFGNKDFTFDENFKSKAEIFNSANNIELTKKQMLALKKQGINTLCPEYPQPYWFYDLTDKLGFYVIDTANINNSKGRGDLKIGGTPSNNPELLGFYLSRIERMYDRGKNRTSIVAWSLGGLSGNGFNMYRAYKKMKELDAERPVLYPDGDWNTDFKHPAY